MKRPFFLALLGAILLAIAFLGYKIIRGNAEKERIASQIKTLPELPFFTLDGKPFSRQRVPPSTPVVIVHFLPDCHFCQGEAKELAANAALFSKARIFMVSAANSQAIQQFGKLYGLDAMPSITLLSDSLKMFGQTFGTVNVPVTFVYTEEQRLAKQFMGETSAQGIYKALSSFSNAASSSTP
jgi:peroxiredoxin